MNKPQKLHPIFILFDVPKHFVSLLPVFIFLWVQIEDWLITLGICFIVFLCLLVYSVFEWIRSIYFIDHGEFCLQKGGIFHKKVFIPLEQIQAVEIEQKLWHRLFDVVEVHIETASGNDSEAVLKAVKKTDALSLQKFLLREENKVDLGSSLEKNQNDTSIFYRVTWKTLIQAGMTSGKIVYTLSLPVLFGLKLLEYIDEASQFIDVDAFIEKQHFEMSMLMHLFWIIPSFLIVAWLISIVWTVIEFAYFKVRRDEKRLYVEYGFFHLRKLTIPIKRIQMVNVEENWLRQPLGWALVKLEIAGYGENNDEESKEKKKIVLFPLVSKREIPSLLQHILPEYVAYTDIALRPTPIKSKVYRLIPQLIGLIIVQCIFFYLSPTWSWIGIPVILILMVYQWLRYQDEGWGLAKDGIVLRNRVLVRNTFYVPQRSMQSRTCLQSRRMKRAQLARFRTFISSGRKIRSGYIAEMDVEQILDWIKMKSMS
ncbi:PH domain-containing protein [Thermoflavimicrobium daqui]|uniref:YdbS-like PH domain-containing protein n=1 Tax=Thermoflavimicrobium daqui TaxID=2137476 RepID=A0A364K9Q1_9BACL|nr:PH domain-containing protein [Thermoflavimicrobium daqui]RAL26930.1 hypothetical protein DL897_02470 [Thermoflavimicrobium daqui]